MENTLKVIGLITNNSCQPTCCSYDKLFSEKDKKKIHPHRLHLVFLPVVRS